MKTQQKNIVIQLTNVSKKYEIHHETCLRLEEAHAG